MIVSSAPMVSQTLGASPDSAARLSPMSSRLPSATVESKGEAGGCGAEEMTAVEMGVHGQASRAARWIAPMMCR